MLPPRDLGGVSGSGVACCLVPSGGGAQADAEDLAEDDGGHLGSEVHERGGPSRSCGDTEPTETRVQSHRTDRPPGNSQGLSSVWPMTLSS